VSGLHTPADRLTRLARKRLHLGVCGSVACYRAADLLRAWLALDLHVSAPLTPGARQFVAPLLFASLGAAPVYEAMFTPGQEVFAHLEPASTLTPWWWPRLRPTRSPAWPTARQATCWPPRPWPLTGRWSWPRP
jgi:hypothetical protein